MPATAFGYVFIALLARFWLHEPISVERWMGIVLITIGVGFVSQGPSLTERPRKETQTGAVIGATELTDKEQGE